MTSGRSQSLDRRKGHSMKEIFYLDDRLGLALTLLCPPAGFIVSLINLRNDTVNWRRYTFCIAWAMGAFAYCYQPLLKSSSDLIRYFAYCEKLGNLPLAQIWGNGIHGEDNLYIFELLCWVVGKIGDVHLLPAISVFLVYYIGMYVTCVLGEQERCSKKSVVRYVFFILMAVSFYSITNNVRNILAFALSGYAIFRDCYEKKHDLVTSAMYVIPWLIHPSAILILIVRALMGMIGKMKVVSTVAVLVVPFLLETLDRVLSGVYSGNIIVRTFVKMIRMANSYFHDDTSAWANAVKNSGAQTLLRIFNISIVVIMLYDLYLQHGIPVDMMRQDRRGRNVSMENFVFFTILLTLSCLPMTQPQYWRFASLAILFGGSIYLGMEKTKDPYIISKRDYLLIPAAGVWVVAFRELLLYANVGVMFLRTLICNPFVLLTLRALGGSIEIIQ